ncbi:hypothetical protein EV424DRAFT_1347798 [Suillus variegatus]|nr:hypothetical protein EV424DRAFT_1347798 [Suillus variegatus]
MVRKHADQVNQLKLQACNDSRKHMYALTQLDDYNRLVMAISENDIPHIHQVINIALRNASEPLRGVSFMIDEIALEEIAVHFSKHNKVGGLCWKHSHIVDPVLRTYDSAVNIAQKIHKGEVHLGKELTVIGVSCFGENGIYPVLAAPTCKMEDASDMEIILARTVNRWNASGAATSVRPAWSFATDGDATRCAAGHRLFVKTLLPPDSTLYGTLINMPGLNLFTGAGICTLIRSPAGIVLNNSHVINSMMLARYLLWLPAYDEQAVMKLLHPDDPQDVPHAVELMLTVIEFSNSQHALISDSFSVDVDTHADLTSISLLSALLQAILTPFIDVNLSLSQQFEHLSCYAHLAFAFFHAHRRSFMSYQLYYNTQTMVKNAFFCLAKQQSLDPYAPFFLGDVGDDPLEILFGRTHMIGGHNSACSYAQALDRLGAAKDIDGIFKHHSELDPGHHRLKLMHREGVDHINQEIWKGDIISGRCDFSLAWHKGHDDALSILITSQLAPTHYSFTELFSTREVDMLCLFGQNKYLGISADDEIKDNSRVPEVPLPIPVPPPIQSLETVLSNEEERLPNEQEHLLGELRGSKNDEEIMLTFQEALIDESPSDAPSALSDIHHPLDPSTPPLPAGPGIRYTKVNKHINMSAGRITDHNLFLVGDIFLTVLRSGCTLSIGVLRSTTATLNGVSCASINIAVMKATLLDINPYLRKLTSVLNLPSVTAIIAPQGSFLWDGGYVTARSIIQGTNESTARIVVVTIPGALVEPVNPEPTFIRLRDNVNSDKFCQVNGGQSTWQISREALQAAYDLLWAKAVEIKVTLKTIAAVTPSDVKRFPYQLSDGTPAILSVEASNQLCASEGETISICPLCEMKVSNMRYHMGLHILCALNNVSEDINMKQTVGDISLCSFCRRSGHPDCGIFITIKNMATGNTPTWNTKCLYQHGFRYAFAEQGLKNKPVRNVPLKCELCHPILPPEPGKSLQRVAVVAVDAIWCYNMVEHILNEHEEYSVPGRRAGGIPVPTGVLRAMQFTELEQASTNIPREKWQPFSIPGDGHDKENAVPSNSRAPKRSAPSTMAPQASKKTRTNLTNVHAAVSLCT